ILDLCGVRMNERLSGRHVIAHEIAEEAGGQRPVPSPPAQEDPAPPGHCPLPSRLGVSLPPALARPRTLVRFRVAARGGVADAVACSVWISWSCSRSL